MIKDIIYSEYHSDYSKILDNKLNFYFFGDCTYIYQEYSSNRWDHDLHPAFDFFSIGKSSGIIAYYKLPLSGVQSRLEIRLYDNLSHYLFSIFINSKCSYAIPYVLPNDDLIVLTDRGAIFKYSQQEEIFNFNISNNYPNFLILKECFYENGVVILTTNGDLLNIYNFEKVEHYHHFESIGKPKSLFVISPKNFNDINILIFIVTFEGNYIIANHEQFYEVKLSIPLIAASINYSNDKIALLQEDMKLIITNINLNQIYYEYIIDMSLNEFLTLNWAGNYLPIVCSSDTVLICPEESSHQSSHIVNSSPILFNQCDSLFILTSSGSSRILIIPNYISELFSNKFTKLPNLLCQIFDNRLKFPFFEQLNKLNTDIELINQSIEIILDAAEFIEDKGSQQFFLNCVCFLHTYYFKGEGNLLNKHLFKIKVLNLLREKTYMPITSFQLNEISFLNIIERLCNRNMHLLAVEIAKLTNSNLNFISSSFSKYIIKNNFEDEKVLSILTSYDFIDFSTSSNIALNYNRESLAKLLLNYEKSLSQKAKLFAKMEQWVEAINFASNTCDLNTLFDVLNNSLKSSLIDNVNSAIAQNPNALFLLINFYYLISSNRFKDILNLIPINSSFYYVNSIYYLIESNNYISFSSLQNLKELNDIQKDIVENIGNRTLIGLSLNETIMKLIELDLIQIVKGLIKKCQIDQKKFTLLRIHSLCRSNKWISLNKYGSKKKRKSFWPLIIEFCLKYGNQENALSFIEEVGVIDPKFKNNYIQQVKNNQLGINNLFNKKSYFTCFNPQLFM